MNILRVQNAWVMGPLIAGAYVITAMNCYTIEKNNNI